MFDQSKREEVLHLFDANANASFESVLPQLGIDEAMKRGDANATREGVKNIQNILISVIPEGVAVPKATLHVSASSTSGTDEITVVNISLSNSLKSLKKFKFTSVIVGTDIARKVYGFLHNIYTLLIDDEMIDANLEHVNHVLSQAVAEAGLQYAVSVVSPLGNESKKVAYLADDEVQFVADADRVFSISDMVIFSEPNEFISEKKIQETYGKMVNALSKAQTPVQLVAMYGGSFVSFICDISNRLKPQTIINKVCNKNSKALIGNKDAIAYFKDGDVFSIVSRRDGEFEVLLSPINITTLEPVDYDVLKALA